nr:hypothetical protein [Tanacetum cinerariifolium]
MALVASVSSKVVRTSGVGSGDKGGGDDRRWCRNMNSVAAQQVPLDNALVALEKQLKIEKCNAILEFRKPQREYAYQVTLGALKLSPCYPAFLIIVEEDFMFQADNREISSTRKENMPYLRFTKVIIDNFISKDKTISMRNQKYGTPILKEMTNQYIKDSKAYKTYLAFATRQATPKKARKFKKISLPLKKLSLVLEEEHAKKPKGDKKPAKIYTIVSTTSVVIRDTLNVSVSKKKAPAKETHKLYASSSGDGVGSQLKVLDESQDNCEVDDSNDDDSDDVTNDGNDDITHDDGNDDDSDNDDGDNDSDDVMTKFDDDKNDGDQERNEEEYEELYKDVNIRLKDVEQGKEGKRDAEKTDASHDDVN